MDQYDIIAVILGVMFTLRKLDTQSRNAAQHPGVDPEDFLRWQRQTVSAYVPGAYASFAREIVHYLFAHGYLAHHPLSPMTYARVGLTVDFVWIVSVVSTLLRAHWARELRKKLGIVLEKPEPTS